jgi:hypothetical protein
MSKNLVRGKIYDRWHHARRAKYSVIEVSSQVLIQQLFILQLRKSKCRNVTPTLKE